MIGVLVVILLLIASYAVWKTNGSPNPFDPAPPVRPPNSGRFSGRRVDLPVPGNRAPRPARRSRMRNGSQVAAVRNGHAVTPPDTIGLACLAPISECTLGPRCMCVTPEERRLGGSR